MVFLEWNCQKIRVHNQESVLTRRDDRPTIASTLRRGSRAEDEAGRYTFNPKSMVFKKSQPHAL
jgi:hypothetical protein